MSSKAVITQKLEKIFEEKNLSSYKLAKLIGYHDGNLGQMFRGNKKFPDEVIEKIAPILDISPDTITGWILADKYPPNILKIAFEVKQKPIKPVKWPQQKVKPKKNLILTAEIDQRLVEKDITRNKLSDLINEKQGKINPMIIGKKSMSPAIIQKIAAFLEIQEDEIRAWIMADKYSLEALQVAVEML